MNFQKEFALLLENMIVPVVLKQTETGDYPSFHPKMWLLQFRNKGGAHFYRLESPCNKGFILDAKYKRLQNGVAREDLYQIVTYMHTMKIEHGGFLYPIPSENIIEEKYKLAGYGGTISKIGFPIPKSKSFKDFAKSMKDSEKVLLCSILALT